MPTPIGHSLVGYAVAEAGGVRLSRRAWLSVLIVVVLSNLPDFDFIPGYLAGQPGEYHRQALHSLSAAVPVGLVGAVVAAALRRSSRSIASYFLVGSAIYASHLFLDMITPDTRGVAGIPLFWPVSGDPVDVPVPIPAELLEIERSLTSDGFVGSLFTWRNLRVAAIETLVLLPVLLGARSWRRRRDAWGSGAARHTGSAFRGPAEKCR